MKNVVIVTRDGLMPCCAAVSRLVGGRSQRDSPARVSYEHVYRDHQAERGGQNGHLKCRYRQAGDLKLADKPVSGNRDGSEPKICVAMF